MANLAIITARGGSKRIPGKNIKNFNGKPIIAYSIDVALQCGLFDEVMVSTDDEKIANIALQFGAKVPFMRSEETSSDFATTTAVIEEVLENYKAKNLQFENACCLYPTAPFITKERLVEAFQKLNDENLASVFPVVAFSYPIWRGLRFKTNKVEMIWKENLSKRSQDLEPTYHDAGQFYWFNVNKFLNERAFFNSNSNAIILSELEVQDIDNETDWKIAEIKYKIINNLSE